MLLFLYIVGKISWPELFGRKGDERAITIIQMENHMVTAVFLVPEGSAVTDDFRCNRVRLWINHQNIIVRVPIIG